MNLGERAAMDSRAKAVTSTTKYCSEAKLLCPSRDRVEIFVENFDLRER